MKEPKIIEDNGRRIFYFDVGDVDPVKFIEKMKGYFVKEKARRKEEEKKKRSS